ncbi:hypothetical protein M405DRAFT_861957 [Rhizopogon salebrosus TDB-379]|nr:hypothetical protein M405DRAFT_861957 [Rhizopogon salebrosus TDB-379]
MDRVRPFPVTIETAISSAIASTYDTFLAPLLIFFMDTLSSLIKHSTTCGVCIQSFPKYLADLKLAAIGKGQPPDSSHLSSLHQAHLLATIMKHAKTLSVLKGSVPWHDLMQFFTTIPWPVVVSYGQ